MDDGPCNYPDSTEDFRLYDNNIFITAVTMSIASE